ncbi:MAG: hypothetical protein O3B87_05840 [bacterium]|nr:hypothetical protein [bacterium]
MFVAIRLAAFHKSLLNEMLKLSRMKKVALTLCVLASASAIITTFMYVQNRGVSIERIREQVKAIAATAAQEFDTEDLNVIHDINDISRPEWEKIVLQLQSIRKRNPDVRYVYILRPTSKTDIFEFVADADSMDPFAKIDLNNDGIIDDFDALNPPGDPYDISDIPSIAQGMVEPSADEEPFTDKWGTFISGFAPIKDDKGNTVAVLGVDRLAKHVTQLTLGTFNPIATFFGFFVIFVLIRFAVFFHNLAAKLIQLSRTKKVLVSLLVCAGIALVITAGMYKYTLELMKEEIGTRLMSIVATAAPEIDAKDLEPLRFARDMRRPEYQRVFEKLNEIRDNNEDIWYVYVMRPSWYEGTYEFVADADSNYFLPLDENPDPIEVVPPGTMYDHYFFGEKYRKYVMKHPLREDNIVTDKWGSYLSASAPIYDNNGNAVAFLGLDMDVSIFYDKVNNVFKKYIWFLATLSFLLLTRLISLFQIGNGAKY